MDQVAREICCPITHQLFLEPVMTRDGHVYEREAIERWLRANDTSPVTGLLLSDKSVTPLHTIANTVQHLVGLGQQWRVFSVMDTRDWLRRKLQASTTNAANRADMNDLLARAFTGNSDENLQIAQLQLHIQLVRMADDGRRDAQYVIEQLASFGERGDISSGWAPSEGDVVTCTAARVGFSRLKVMIDSVPSTPWPTVRGVLGKTGLVERVDEDSSSVLVRFAHEPEDLWLPQISVVQHC